jgi:hypothetical protein
MELEGSAFPNQDGGGKDEKESPSHDPLSEYIAW